MMVKRFFRIARDHGALVLIGRAAGFAARTCVRRLKGREDRRFDASALRAAGKPLVLIVDQHVPFYDRDAGSRRIEQLIRMFSALGYAVVFASLDRREYPPYGRHLREMGVPVLTGFNARTLRAPEVRGLLFDVVWLSRPTVASVLMDVVRAAMPSASIVYDTVDLHYRRMEREERVTGITGCGETGGDWRVMRDQELSLAGRADLTVVTSEPEGEELRAAGIERVARFGVFEPRVSDVPGWDARSGVIFVGNYAHAPNVDAACVLSREIFPFLRERGSGISLTLAGADPTTVVRKLAGAGIAVPGYVGDLEALLGRSRVFSAPLRFGAGVKGKIVQALACGMPVVTSMIGAEGLPDPDEWGIVTDDAADHARALLRVHEDRALWERLSAGASRTSARLGMEAAAQQLTAVLSSL